MESTNVNTAARGAEQVVIVGAGFAGLAAAVRLVDAGLDVMVVEATGQGGGRSRSFFHQQTGIELDNGQHLLMGCYRETLAFLRTIGTEHLVEFQRNLSLDMIRPGGQVLRVRCPALPAPLHLAAGLLAARGLGLVNKASVVRAGLALRGEVARPDDNETCDAWLRRLGQTAGIRAIFWEPLIWAVLNDDPLVSSAAMLVAVLERAFLGTRDASRLGVATVPLSRLYVGNALDYIRARGAKVRLGQPMRSLEVGPDGIEALRLRSGERIPCATVISAVPPEPLLTALPQTVRRDPIFQDIGQLKASPIVNLWAFLDRPLFEKPPFVGLIGSPFHWIFNRSQIEGRDDGPKLFNCTISGARALVEDRPAALVELFRDQVQRYFPGKPFQIQDYKVVKERRATISHAAGTYQRRPETVSPVRGLFLAGDWVRTGLPATIESACQSGHDAAAAVLKHRRASAF